MFSRLFILSTFVLAAQVHAAEAGKVIFSAGDAKIAERAGAEGAAVQEGELLSTGADGFLYIKTLDNGLFILRPNTQARIVAYHVDQANPANTRVKLELLKGVARSKSGEAVKKARQNFRFNTPVAAIGVRGTDFTVYTDQDTSRVAVLTGGIVMSGFAGACRPDGAGPCEGATSRELSASQQGQLLQVRRGQAAPQLLQGGAGAPDLVSPPRADEPVAKSAVGGSASGMPAEPMLDPQKTASLHQIVNQGNSTPTEPTVTPPPVLTDVKPTPPTPVEPELPARQLQWGRWVSLLGRNEVLSLSGPADAERIINGNFVMYWTAGKEFVSPAQGSMGFVLKDSEAYVTAANGVPVSAVQLKNGVLNIDFGSRAFNTSMDMDDGIGVYKLHATGAVTSNGRLAGDQTYSRPGYINVQGALSNDKGGSAAYLFDGYVDYTRTVNGATTWTKQ